MHIEGKGGLKDIHCIAQIVALFDYLLKISFSLLQRKLERQRERAIVDFSLVHLVFKIHLSFKPLFSIPFISLFLYLSLSLLRNFSLSFFFHRSFSIFPTIVGISVSPFFLTTTSDLDVLLVKKILVHPKCEIILVLSKYRNIGIFYCSL